MEFLRSLAVHLKSVSKSAGTVLVFLLIATLVYLFSHPERFTIRNDSAREQYTNPHSFLSKDHYDIPPGYSASGTVPLSPGQWKCIGPSPTEEGYAGRLGFVSYDKRDSNILYLGAANGGIWKSTDRGQSWLPKTDNLPSLACGAFVIDYKYGTLYFGSGDAVWTNLAYPGDGIYKSTDFGENWSKISSTGLPALTRFYKLVVDPVRDGCMYAATPKGLFRSVDFARTWNKIIPSSADSLNCTDVIVSPDGMNIYAIGPGNYCPVCGTPGIGYWKSSNGGVSFVQKTNTGFPHITNLPAGRTQISLCESHPNIIYLVSMYDEYLDSANYKPYYAYKSTNGGENFVLINGNEPILWATENAGYNMNIEVSPYDSNVCFIGAQNLYRSTDGFRFSCVTGYCGAPSRMDFHTLQFSPFSDKSLIAGNDGGIYRSADLGLSFENLNAKISVTQIYRISSSPANTSSRMLGVQDMGVLLNRDTGWYVSSIVGDGGAICYSNVYSNKAVTCLDNSGWLYYSENEGRNWVKSSAYSGKTDWIAPFAAHPNSGDVFYTVRNNLLRTDQLDIYRSIDGGKNWMMPDLSPYASIQNPDIAGLYPMGISISNVHPDLMYLFAGNRYSPLYKPSVIFRSVNGGLSWSQNWLVKGGVGGFPDCYFTQMKTDPAISNEVLLTVSGYAGKHVFRSISAGESWEDISANLPNYPANDIVTHYITQSMKEYFVATDHGVYRTYADNINWQKVGSNLPNTACTSLDYNRLDCKLRVSTYGRSVWEIDIPGDIFVRDNLYLSALEGGTLNINDNLIICKGASLNVVSNCYVMMAKDKKIIVQDGGKFNVADNLNVYFTASGDNWGGLELVSSQPMEIRNSGFSNCKTPITIKSYLGSGSKTNGLINISHCVFDNGVVLINNRNNVRIENSSWYYSGSVGAIYSIGSDSIAVVNNRLNCTSPTLNSIGFDFVWGNYIYVAGNTLTNPPVGISISSNSAYVSNNRIFSIYPGNAYVGIGILNCSDAFVLNNTISSYRQGIKSLNSLPVLLNNVVADSTKIRGRTAALYCDRYSFPRLAPVNSNGAFLWDGGVNSLLKPMQGSAIKTIGSSLPLIDYGSNNIYGFNYFISSNSPWQLMARNNCWGGDYPHSYRFDVPGGVTYDPVNCSSTGRFGKRAGSGLMQGIFVIDRGLGFYDTVNISSALIENDAESSILNLGRMQLLESKFSDAELTFRNFLQTHKSGLNAVEALNKIIYCYERQRKEAPSYYDLRSYYLQLAGSGTSDSIFINTARDLSRRALVKSGQKKDALYEYEDAVTAASDSAALISAEVSVIDDYTLINTGLDTTNFTGRLPYLKPADFFNAAQMVFDRVYNLKGDTVISDYSMPVKFFLSQNYPNPFNPVTSIFFSLPKSVHVRLTVYDILGRLLGTFMDENKDAGYYIYSFNGSNYASGVYFYRFEAGDFTDAKKMVLLK